MSQRTVLCHYHIFKNSGTTFERVLDDNYGEDHLTFDGPFSYFQINQDQLCNVIERNTAAVAVSSHQIHLPVPTSVHFRAVPVVFIRHPLLRIRSIYLFNVRQDHADTDEESAPRDPMEGFADWLQSALSNKNQRMLISNAQTNMLCRAYNQAPRFESRGGRLVYDITNAARNLQAVPCLGRTEHFDHDVAKFTQILNEFGVDFSYHAREPENVSSNDYEKPISERLESMRMWLTDTLWDNLCFLNHQDLELYDIAESILDMDLSVRLGRLPKQVG